MGKSMKITVEGTYNSAEQGVHLSLPEGWKVERGVVLGVTSVIDTDEPSDEGLGRWMRDDLGGVGSPLLHLVDEVDSKVVV